jgi:AraC-like DNA-binding protein
MAGVDLESSSAAALVTVSDQRMAARIAQIRGEQLERLRRRVGTAIPTHVVSEEALTAIAHDIREAEILRVLHDPAFPAVAQVLAELGSGSGAGAVIDKALRDVTRLVVATFALYLDATPGGLTHSRLTALLEASRSGGRTHAYAMIAYMQFLAYIEPAGEGTSEALGDGRARLYRPTERMRSAFRGYFTAQLRAIAPLHPEVTALADRLDEPQVFARYVALIGEGLLASTLLMRPQQEPPFNLFSRRKSGLVMLWTLLLSPLQDGPWPPVGFFPVSVNDIARRAGVSRAHFQRLLDDGERAGLLARGEGGTVRVRQLLRREVNTFLILVILSQALVARRTAAELGIG